MSNDLISTSEAAEVLGVSIATVTRLATGERPELQAAAKAPGARGARLFRRRDVERLAAKRAKEQAA